MTKPIEAKSMPNPSNRLTCIITIDLIDEDGKKPSKLQIIEASDTLHTAIQNRLFGEGFLPEDILADTWDITIN
jgi:hypothetical protein